MIRALSPAQPIHASRRSEARVAQSPHDATLAAMPEVGVKVGSFCSLDSVGVRMVNNNTRFCSLLDNDASPHPTDHQRLLVERVNSGLRSGFEPVLADDGTGGVYFLRDSSGENVAVFKPSDEEPGTPNNPRGLNSPLVSSPFLYSPLTSINRSVSHPLPTTSSAYKQMSTPLPRSHQPEIINGFAAHGDLEFGSKRVPIAQITDNKSDARAAFEFNFFSTPAHSETVSASLPTPKLHTPTSSPALRSVRAFGAASTSLKSASSALSDDLERRQRSGIPGGSAACREVAAYLLDYEHRACVPMTTLVLMQHEAFHSADAGTQRGDKKIKIGSLQAYVRHSLDADEQPPAVLRRIDVDDVHRLAVFDIRLSNTDRHGGNILLLEDCDRPSSDDSRHNSGSGSGNNSTATARARRLLTRRHAGDIDSDADSESDDADERSADDNVVGRLDESLESADDIATRSPIKALSSSAPLRIVPIDHGYTLPSNLEELWFEWSTWPQARVPFSAATLAYVEQLDWRRDVAALRKFGDVFGADTLVVVRVSTTLLQHAARRRLTPADVASLLCRMGGLDEPAVVETLLVRARQRTAALSLSLSSSSTSTSPVLSTSVTTTITHESATRVIATTALDDEAFFAAFEQLLEERLEAMSSLTKTKKDSAQQFKMEM